MPKTNSMIGLSNSNPRSFGRWGVMTVIMTESALFAYLLFSYYYFAVQYGHGFLPDELPKLRLALPNTLILLASSASIWWAEQSARRGDDHHRTLGLAITLVLGVVFIALQSAEWANKPFTLSSSSYGSLYYTITGFHMAHVFAGLIAIAVVGAWSWTAERPAHESSAVSIGALYWHFVDAVWLTVFFTFYITPYLV